jgi:hypothetical protein
LLRLEYRQPGDEGWIELDPLIHHNKVMDSAVKFRGIFSPRNTLFSPVD